MKFIYIVTSFILVNFLSPSCAMDQPNDHLRTLFSFANKGHWTSFEQSLYFYKGPLDLPNEEGNSLLQVAVNAGLEGSVEELIKKGADVLCHSYFAKESGKIITIPTPLHLAVQRGNVAIAQMLINADKNTIKSNKCDYNNTPLHIAAWFNQPHMIPLLIDNGADSNETNDFGSTPVHLAAWRNNSNSLKKLLEYKAYATQANKTGRGNTPIYLAAKAGSTQSLQILIKFLSLHLSSDEFRAHINQPCSGDNSLAIQAAAVREHPQCYWDLVVAGGDYKAKYKGKSNAEEVDKYVPNVALKNFIQHIEQCGKDNPPRYTGTCKKCFMCNTNYNHNDVIMTLLSCSHNCHADCFKNFVLEAFIEKSRIFYDRNNAFVQFIQHKSNAEIKYELLTNTTMHVAWNTITSCPQCKVPFNNNINGHLSVFLEK